MLNSSYFSSSFFLLLLLLLRGLPDLEDMGCRGQKGINQLFIIYKTAKLKL